MLNNNGIPIAQYGNELQGQPFYTPCDALSFVLRLDIVGMTGSVAKARKTGLAFRAAIKGDATEGGGACQTRHVRLTTLP